MNLPEKTRVDTEEFVQQIKKAPKWRCWVDMLDQRNPVLFLLTFNEHGDSVDLFVSPSAAELGVEEFGAFVKLVKIVCALPGMMEKKV